jgi:hypothetical protein
VTSREWKPGLSENGEDVDVTFFPRPERRRKLYVAKWWMRPICWLLGRPTRVWL